MMQRPGGIAAASLAATVDLPEPVPPAIPTTSVCEEAIARFYYGIYRGVAPRAGIARPREEGADAAAGGAPATWRTAGGSFPERTTRGFHRGDVNRGASAPSSAAHASANRPARPPARARVSVFP